VVLGGALVADDLGADVRDRAAREDLLGFVRTDNLDLLFNDDAVGLQTLLVRVLVDRALLVTTRRRLAGTEVVLDGALRTGAVVALRDQRVLAGADARIEVAAEQDLLVDLVAVLDVLDAEEGERACDRDRDAGDEALLLVELRAAHGPRRGQRREDEDSCIDRAVLHVEPLVGVAVNLAVVDAVQDVRDEQRREEQDFLREEEPDA